MSDNAQQIEFWNGPPGQRWAALTETTDRTLSLITSALMPFAAAKTGERVLDIGCGCGSTTLDLAAATGTSGSVTGIDISRPMLDVAQRRAGDAGARISFIEADASVHAFKPEFDLVFSRFGVMFFSDPLKAFANIRKALSAGGRIVFVCWRSFPENIWAASPLAAASDLLPPQPPVDPHAPGPFAFADGERLISILGRAGFREARTETLDTVANMGSTLKDAVEASLNIGPLSRAAMEVDQVTRDRVRERVSGALAAFETPAGITPPAACWLVSARA
jgi:SAM-dependent methyltransferase